MCDVPLASITAMSDSNKLYKGGIKFGDLLRIETPLDVNKRKSDEGFIFVMGEDNACKCRLSATL